MIRIFAALWILTFIFACTNESQREPNSFKLNKEIPQKSQIEIGKKVSEKNIINEFILKDSKEVYFEKMSFISIFGKTIEGRIFTGKIMWFKSYFDENLSTKGSFYYFLEDILINPQEEKKIKKIVGEREVFDIDDEIAKDSILDFDTLIDKYIILKPDDDYLYLRKKFWISVNTKYSIAYLFYLKGYILMEYDYEPLILFLPVEKAILN